MATKKTAAKKKPASKTPAKKTVAKKTSTTGGIARPAPINDDDDGKGGSDIIR